MIPKNRYNKIKELFQQAMALSEEKQTEFLKQIELQNPSLGGELEFLLANDEEEKFNKMPEKISDYVRHLMLVEMTTEVPKEQMYKETKSFTLSSGANQKAARELPKEQIYKETKSFTSSSGANQRTVTDNEPVKELFGGRYEIEYEIGRGGFAIVYLAKDVTLHNRPVIIKLFNRLGSKNENWAKDKFGAEIKALSKLNHPNVVTIFDYGVLKDTKPFFVMEYIQGTNLRGIINKSKLGSLLEETIAVINQIASALDAAHRLGIYHRDLKPENIMIQPLGNEHLHVKVIDFGIATVEDSIASVQTNSVAGTPAYMSPEQLEGQSCLESDIYALGVITYELLTGRVPFNLSHFKNFAKVVSKLKEMQKQALIIKPSLLNPSLSTEVDEVLLKALSYEPKERFRQASQFAQALSKAVLTKGANLLYWNKLCDLAQPTEAIKLIDKDTREDLKINNNLSLIIKQKCYNYPLHSNLSIVLSLKQEGHLLLIAKDLEDDGLAYCLCPSHFAASDKLIGNPILLPTEGLIYKHFSLADKVGKKQILAIVSRFPINLDLESSFKIPAQILTTENIYSLLVKLQKLPLDEWSAFSTIINIS